MNHVRAFEQAFAEYVGAKHCIALCNGTATLHTALVALGVKPGDRVAVPPLTMSSTTIAVLHAGAVPVFCDVDPRTWVMGEYLQNFGNPMEWDCYLPVSIYGLHAPDYSWADGTVDDAAQTLRPHSGCAFTSYSFQASKILPLGEGGMLATNDDDLAQRAREFSSLGYRMKPDGPEIDKRTLKHPDHARHHSLGWNYRMAGLVADRGLDWLTPGRDMTRGGYFDKSIHRPITTGADILKQRRLESAALYREAIEGCEWLTPQHVPDGWVHDYWTFAVACDTKERALWLLDAMERHGGERPYPAWRLTYQEPAFRHLAPDGTCPVAESLQPRLVQFQTNRISDAERNAEALRKAIKEAG